MPASGLRVTQVFVYALPGLVQSFSAKAEAAAITTTHTYMRYHQRGYGMWHRIILIATGFYRVMQEFFGELYGSPFHKPDYEYRR